MAKKVSMRYGNTGKKNQDSASSGGGGSGGRLTSVNASASTLEAGSPATVTASYSAATGVLTLHFGIPQGEKGAPGGGLVEYPVLETDGSTGPAGQYTVLEIS